MVIRLLMSILMMVSATTATAEPGEVMRALFKKKHGFQASQSNDELQAVLAKKPQMDLFETAAVGSKKQLEQFLAADPAAIRARSDNGWTLLHLAAFAGNVANAQLLLDRGADVNARAMSRFRNTPLLVSLLTDQHEMAKLLLDHGADVLSRQANGFAPIHEAAFRGRKDIVDLLLQRGAELNSRTDDGRTAYTEALRGKHEALAAHLKQLGAVGELSADVMTSPR